MSLTPCQTNDLLDNKLFEFDPYEPSVGGGFLEGSSRSPTAPSSHGVDRSNMANRAGSTYAADTDLNQPIRSSTTIEEVSTGDVIGKGKGISRPVPIRAHVDDTAHDVFDMSPPGLHSFSPPVGSTGLSPSLSLPTDIPFDSSYASVPDDTDAPLPEILGPDFPGDLLFDDETFATHTFGKGKGREMPPSLPPLQFSPTEFEQTVWPRSGSTSAGPSSFGSGFASIAEPTPIPEITAQVNPPTQTPPTLRRIPSRRRSLSNLSIRSDISQAARSITRVRAKFRGSRTLARKLLFRKREAFSNPSSRPTSAYEPGHLSLENADLSDITPGSCFMPWLGEIKPRRDSVTGLTCHVDAELRPALQRCFPVFESSDQKHPTSKHKGRSNSSPFPMSALDIIPATSSDVFAPIPIVIRNYFDNILPKELRLQILASLVLLHQEDHEKALRDGQWTISKATSSRNKFVGRDQGIRELVRMSRVRFGSSYCVGADSFPFRCRSLGKPWYLTANCGFNSTSEHS
jgi:F-box and leucine-rich repeat protein 2/20